MPDVGEELNQTLTNECQEKERKLFAIPPYTPEYSETQWFHMAFPDTSV